MYKQLIKPIITYAYTCWMQISSFQVEKLEKIERKFLRKDTYIKTKQQINSLIATNEHIYKSLSYFLYLNETDQLYENNKLLFFIKKKTQIKRRTNLCNKPKPNTELTIHSFFLTQKLEKQFFFTFFPIWNLKM